MWNYINTCNKAVLIKARHIQESSKMEFTGGYNLTFVGLGSLTKIGKYNLSWLSGADLDSCKVGVKIKLRFLCVGGSKMQNMMLLEGLGTCSPENFWKTHALRLNLVFSEAQNCYAKDRLCRSAVREISLAVHATVYIFKIK